MSVNTSELRLDAYNSQANLWSFKRVLARKSHVYFEESTLVRGVRLNKRHRKAAKSDE